MQPTLGMDLLAIFAAFIVWVIVYYVMTEPRK